MFLPAKLTPYFQLKIQHKFLSFQKTCWFLHSIKQYRNNSAVTKKSKLNADTNHYLLPLSSQAITRQAWEVYYGWKAFIFFQSIIIVEQLDQPTSIAATRQLMTSNCDKNAVFSSFLQSTEEPHFQ